MYDMWFCVYIANDDNDGNRNCDVRPASASKPGDANKITNTAMKPMKTWKTTHETNCNWDDTNSEGRQTEMVINPRKWRWNQQHVDDGKENIPESSKIARRPNERDDDTNKNCEDANNHADDLWAVFKIPSILGSVIPELIIINQQGFRSHCLISDDLNESLVTKATSCESLASCPSPQSLEHSDQAPSCQVPQLTYWDLEN